MLRESVTVGATYVCGTCCGTTITRAIERYRSGSVCVYSNVTRPMTTNGTISSHFRRHTIST